MIRGALETGGTFTLDGDTVNGGILTGTATPMRVSISIIATA